MAKDLEKWELQFADFLRSCLEESKSRNTRFSVRAFAKKIGLSPGSLSQILNNKGDWRISAARAEQILHRIDIKPKQRERLLVKMGRSPTRKITKLQDASYKYLTEWSFIPILMAHDLPPSKKTISALSARLGIGEQKVITTIRTLLAEGFLTQASPRAEIVRNDKTWMTDDNEIPVPILRKYHENILNMSKNAMENLPLEKRDITAMTFTGTYEQLDEVKKEIRQLYQKVIALTGPNTPEEVFQLNIQLVPLNFKDQK